MTLRLGADDLAHLSDARRLVAGVDKRFDGTGYALGPTVVSDENGPVALLHPDGDEWYLTVIDTDTDIKLAESALSNLWSIPE